MITLLFLFIIQLLGGFFVVLCIEHFKNPSSSLLRLSYNLIKANIPTLYQHIKYGIYIFVNRFSFVIPLFCTSIFLSFIGNLTIRYLANFNLIGSNNGEEWFFVYYIFLFYILPACILLILIQFTYFLLEKLFHTNLRQVRHKKTNANDASGEVKVKTAGY